MDVVLAEALGQEFGRGAKQSDHLLTTGTGIRLAEAASCTTAATHARSRVRKFISAAASTAVPLAR